MLRFVKKNRSPWNHQSLFSTYIKKNHYEYQSYKNEWKILVSSWIQSFGIRCRWTDVVYNFWNNNNKKTAQETCMSPFGNKRITGVYKSPWIKALENISVHWAVDSFSSTTQPTLPPTPQQLFLFKPSVCPRITPYLPSHPLKVLSQATIFGSPSTPPNPSFKTQNTSPTPNPLVSANVVMVSLFLCVVGRLGGLGMKQR